MIRLARDRGLAEAARHGIAARSGRWHSCEQHFLALNPFCAACLPGQNPRAKVQVHHVWPFHWILLLGFPWLELDFRNLIGLCETTHGRAAEDHHLLLGHLGNFKSNNPNVRDDAALFRGMTDAELRADIRFAAKEAVRAPDQLDAAEKAEIRGRIAALFGARPPADLGWPGRLDSERAEWERLAA